MLRNKPIRRHGTTPMGLSVCAAMMGDSSKPIRRHGTTPMSFSVCAAMMGDSSSVAWKPGSGSRDGCSRTSLEAVTETFEKVRSYLNGNHRREQSVQSRQWEKYSLVKSIPIESELFCT